MHPEICHLKIDRYNTKGMKNWETWRNDRYNTTRSENCLVLSSSKKANPLVVAQFGQILFCVIFFDIFG